MTQGEITFVNAKTGQTWVENDPNYAPPTQEEILQEKRSKKALTRTQFFVAAFRAGFITATEAEEAGAGNTLPAAFITAIEDLPEDDQAEARITLRTAQTFDRLHPLMEPVRVALGLTEAQVDAMFGIEA